MTLGAEICQLAVSYNDRPALIDVNLQVPMGHIAAVVGHNGAGKTTLLKALQGRVAKQEGSVRVLGYDPYSYRERREMLPRIRYVADNYQTLFEHLTVREYLEFVAASLRIPGRRIQTAVQLNLNTFGQSDIAECTISTLSHGNKRKLHVASGFILPDVESSIVLLDEPFDGLDPEARAIFYQFLKVFVSHGTNTSRLVIVSSHNLAELDSLATFLVVMRNGKIVSSGTLCKMNEAPLLQTQYALLLSEPRAEEVANTLRQYNMRAHIEDSRSLNIYVEHADPVKYILATIWDRLPGLKVRQLRETTSTLETIYHTIQANL